MIYRGRVRQGVVVFDRTPPLVDGTVVQVQPAIVEFGLDAKTASDFWEPRSLERLVAEQRETTRLRYEDHLGGWPTEESNDDFESSLQEWRRLEGADPA